MICGMICGTIYPFSGKNGMICEASGMICGIICPISGTICGTIRSEAEAFALCHCPNSFFSALAMASLR